MGSATENPMGVEWIGMAMGLGFVLSFGYWCTDFLVVQRAMAQLSETHGEALRLCDLEGESYATIAAVTECPLGTVMSRLFHARRKLARELTETATNEGDLEALRAA